MDGRDSRPRAWLARRRGARALRRCNGGSAGGSASTRARDAAGAASSHHGSWRSVAQEAEGEVQHALVRLREANRLAHARTPGMGEHHAADVAGLVAEDGAEDPLPVFTRGHDDGGGTVSEDEEWPRIVRRDVSRWQ